MKNSILVALLLISPCYAQSQKLNCLQNKHPFGVIATSPALDKIENDLPNSASVPKLEKSWLINEIQKYSRQASQPMLEVGGRYGEISKLMLKEGATVVYNDSDRRHLLHGRESINFEQRQRLYMNTFSYPRGMILPKNVLSGIVYYQSLDAMSPDAMEEGFAKAKGWLVPGGKLFIALKPSKNSLEKMLAKYGFVVEKYDAIDGETMGLIAQLKQK